MKKIVLLGDINTVTVFRLAGIKGIVADMDMILSKVKELVDDKDIAVIVVTQELVDPIRKDVHEINLNSVTSVIVEIPGIDDERGFETSPLEYITEALGVAI